ncbi:hypothetical protein GE09DRAFT_130509 [Coniochaeta sp. 2T2.1]|nr:hypothetical protein GE09DRAFT_130509 [Coniochaeta sp. 2T2.1]
MPRYVVTEPHPTVVQNTYIHAGRGGAGNLFRAPQTTPAEGVPTELNQTPTQPAVQGRFYSGRGGAGNIQSSSVRPVLSLDEEYAITEAREKTHLFAHVGRGGAGNFFGGGVQPEKKDRKMSIASDASNRRDSTSSSGSARSGFLQRISSHLGRQSS